jgi:hypothetical protein
MKKKLLLWGGIFLCSVAILVAQTPTSQITGTVRDSSGGVIPGATVTATNGSPSMLPKHIDGVTRCGGYSWRGEAL